MKKEDLNKIATVGTYKYAASQKLDILPLTYGPTKLIDVVPIKGTNIVINIFRQEVQSTR